MIVVVAVWLLLAALVVAACVSRVRDRRAAEFHARSVDPAGSARRREGLR